MLADSGDLLSLISQAGYTQLSGSMETLVLVLSYAQLTL